MAHDDSDKQFEAYLRTISTASGNEPDYMFRPITSSQAAELLGMTPGSLKKARHEGRGPSGYAYILGVGHRYRSRIDVLRWFWKRHEEALAEPDEGSAA